MPLAKSMLCEEFKEDLFKSVMEKKARILRESYYICSTSTQNSQVGACITENKQIGIDVS